MTSYEPGRLDFRSLNQTFTITYEHPDYPTWAVEGLNTRQFNAFMQLIERLKERHGSL